MKLGRLTLFWRTFLLMAALLALTLAAALLLVRTFDRSPPEQRLAWEIGSLINLTRSALVSSSSDRRIALLSALQTEEQVQIVPMEPSDERTTFAKAQDRRASQVAAIENRLAEAMPSASNLYLRINGQEGLWVSFEIDGDAYWLRFSLDRLDRQAGLPGSLLVLMVLVLALFGAALLSQTINRPLRRLSQAISEVGHSANPTGDKGLSVQAPEEGPAEIVQINRQFSQMALALRQADQDRSLTLAGVSHDLRTPLSRLRLALEMAPLPTSDRDAMVEDIEQIDHIVGQFVEYGRAANPTQPDGELAQLTKETLDGLHQSIESSWRSQLAQKRLILHWNAEPNHWQGALLDLQRILNNLIENALRYGYRAAPQPCSEVWISVRAQAGALLIEVADAGSGIAPSERERLMRPFARGETARTQLTEGGLGPGGSGLGLSIVARLTKRYQGEVELAQASQGGLLIRLALPSLDAINRD